MGLGEKSSDSGDSTEKHHQEECRRAAAERMKRHRQVLVVKWSTLVLNREVECSEWVYTVVLKGERTRVPIGSNWNACPEFVREGRRARLTEAVCGWGAKPVSKLAQTFVVYTGMAFSPIPLRSVTTSTQA